MPPSAILRPTSRTSLMLAMAETLKVISTQPAVLGRFIQVDSFQVKAAVVLTYRVAPEGFETSLKPAGM